MYGMREDAGADADDNRNSNGNSDGDGTVMVISGNGGRGSSVGAIGDRSKLFICLAVAGSIVEVGLQGGGGGHLRLPSLKWDGMDGLGWWEGGGSRRPD